jgi:hypothetical protein
MQFVHGSCNGTIVRGTQKLQMRESITSHNHRKSRFRAFSTIPHRFEQELLFERLLKLDAASLLSRERESIGIRDSGNQLYT